MANMLTPAEQAAQIAAATLPGSARYTVDLRQDGGYSVRDHELAEWVADQDGNEILTLRDAHDLCQEWIYS